MNLQSGLVLSGDAMTRPEAAPGTQAPVEPILQSKSRRAMGLSVAINVSTDRFRISSRTTRLG